MANGGHGSNSLEDQGVPPIFKQVPPEWLPQTSNTADLGYINFFPPNPSQDEEILTETNVKHGYLSVVPFSAETFTQKTKHMQSLKESSTLNLLEDFMNKVFQRKSEKVSQLPSSTFRIPSRATLNDTKRNAWFADLANPEVPLHKLGKSIPHGVKGNLLLDLLHINAVPIPRAVWFVRMVGSNETASVRNKPNYNPMQYSVEWANVMTGYLKKQLQEIILPSMPRPGLNIKQTFKGVLGESDSRDRWVSKFIYSLDLLRIFYNEFMVDHSVLFSWIISFMSNCNLAQAGFITRLADEYILGMVSCRALTQPFIVACLSKLQEISISPVKENLEHLRLQLELLVCRIYLAAPSSFVSPSMWRSFSDPLRSILLDSDIFNGKTEEWKRSMSPFSTSIRETLMDVEKRNQALLFRTNVQPTKGHLRLMVSDVKLLNSIVSTTDLKEISFFDSHQEVDSPHFSRKLSLLLSWSVCYLQYGDHRPYAAASLLGIWRDRTEERASRRDFTSPNELIQDEIFEWLDTNEKARDLRNLTMISILFGELIQKGLFSYDKYIQRLIARGETGLSFSEEPGSWHRLILRTTPLYKFDPPLLNQRRIILYGVRSRTTPEEKVELDLKTELRGLLPEIFSGESDVSMPDASLPRASFMRNTARFEQIRVVRQWLMPSVRKFISRISMDTPEGSSTLLRTYTVVIECLDAMRCYRTGLDFTMELLRQTESSDLLLAIVDNIKRGLSLWACMDTIPLVMSGLVHAHQSWKSRGLYIRCLINLILEIDNRRYLDLLSRQQIIEDVRNFARKLGPNDDKTGQLPLNLDEVYSLSQITDVDAPSALANSLWYKYRSFPEWAYRVWQNVILSLRRESVTIVDRESRRACALRYAKFLLNVDLHFAEGIDSQVYIWLRRDGLIEMRHFLSDAWDMASVFIMHLAVHGAIRITTIMEGIIYPTWKIGLTISDVGEYEANKVLLEVTNTLCRILLVDYLPNSGKSCPPSDLLEMQRLRANRKETYNDINFRHLVQNVSVLVYIECSEYLDSDFREQTTELRQSLCSKSDFRLAASRNVDTVVEAFASPRSGGIKEGMHEPLVAALRLIFNDKEKEDQEESSTLLSPWKLSATAAVTSFVLQQMGQRLEQDSIQDQAKYELSKLAGRLMHKTITPQQADFVSEMTRGVSVEVAGAFVNKGLQRISEILKNTKDELQCIIDLPERAGRFLNLLSTIMLPFRSSTSLPCLAEDIQDFFISCLTEKLHKLENMLRSRIHENREFKSLANSLVNPIFFLARLLQFDLGFPGVWTQNMKNIGIDILNLVLRLTLLYGGDHLTNPVAFTLLLDTAFYIFDEFPQHSSDIFYHCPNLDPSIFPKHMLSEYRALVMTLGKHVAISPLIANLVYATRDADGHLQRGPSVQLRPWEWSENIGDRPIQKKHEHDIDERGIYGTKLSINNNTSIPLEMFEVSMCGEGVRDYGSSGGKQINKAHIRSIFEEDIDAESIFERDWREGRIDRSRGINRFDDVPTVADNDTEPAQQGKDTPTSHRSSPGLSIQTSQGTRSVGTGPLSASTSSRRTQSPTVSNRGDVGNNDMGQTSGGNKGKRKASSAMSDDIDSAEAADSNSRKVRAKSMMGRGGKTVIGRSTKKKK